MKPSDCQSCGGRGKTLAYLGPASGGDEIELRCAACGGTGRASASVTSSIRAYDLPAPGPGLSGPSIDAAADAYGEVIRMTIARGDRLVSAPREIPSYAVLPFFEAVSARRSGTGWALAMPSVPLRDGGRPREIRRCNPIARPRVGTVVSDTILRADPTHHELPAMA